MYSSTSGTNSPSTLSPTQAEPANNTSQPIYFPPDQEPSFSPPAPVTSSSISPSASTFNADLGEEGNDSQEINNEKTQPTGLNVGRPPVFTEAVGVPDIWNIFSAE